MSEGGRDPLGMSWSPDELSLRATPSEPPPIPSAACWRCGKSYAANLSTCPLCRAPNRLALAGSDRVDRAHADTTQASHEVSPELSRAHAEHVFMQTLWVFFILLATSVVQGIVVQAVSQSEQNERAMRRSMNQLMYIVMGVDTVVVFAALAVLGRPPQPPVLARERRIRGGLMSLAVFAGAVGVNFAYHQILLHYLQLPDWLVVDPFDDADAVLVVALCVQPAIVEEAYFRYLALDTLRPLMSVNSAVAISSVMFAVAHLGVPLSMPALAVVGIVLGYARVWSGSLWLPMLLHAAHNAVVCYVELAQ